MYYFYLLRCADNSLYAGSTIDLNRRVNEHNTVNSKASKYTKAHRPVKLVYFEKFRTLQKALAREREVKKWKKEKKEELLNNPISLALKLY